MPEKDGLELIREVHGAFPGLPIIAISGGGRHLGKKTSLDMARLFGARQTFAKPLERKILLACIKELVEENRSS
jgi:DNA-binding response OmpR family regulator